MFTHNTVMYGTKIVGELVGDIVYFPLWWYSRGYLKMIISLRDFIVNRERSLGFFIWTKNLFRPMYGQEDMWGRVISFFVRLIQIIVRGLIMIFWLVFSLSVFIFWTTLPLIIFYGIYLQIT